MYPKALYKDGKYRDLSAVVFSKDEEEAHEYKELINPDEYVYSFDEPIDEPKKRGRPKLDVS